MEILYQHSGRTARERTARVDRDSLERGRYEVSGGGGGLEGVGQAGAGTPRRAERGMLKPGEVRPGGDELKP